MKIFTSASIAVLLSATAAAQPNTTTNLYSGFENPGSAARPRVWWHWMQGNITKDGIRKDLMWMHHAGIKYFSGTATYSKTIDIPASSMTKGAELWLDLGEVKNLAEVMVNGKSLGIVWKKPFRVDATNALKAGANKLEIKVVNTWVNRLIGDAQAGVTNKITYTTMPFYKADSQLLAAGLLGPVKVMVVK